MADKGPGAGSRGHVAAGAAAAGYDGRTGAGQEGRVRRLASGRRRRVRSHRPEPGRPGRTAVPGVPEAGCIGGAVTMSAPLPLHCLPTCRPCVPPLLYGQKCQRGNLPVLILGEYNKKKGKKIQIIYIKKKKNVTMLIFRERNCYTKTALNARN